MSVWAGAAVALLFCDSLALQNILPGANIIDGEVEVPDMK